MTEDCKVGEQLGEPQGAMVWNGDRMKSFRALSIVRKGAAG